MLRFSILSLTTVAALTPAEHDVVICDENVEPLDFESDAGLVGISFMTALANRAYEIAAEFRARGKIVVAGGYHPTLCTEEVTAHFDAVVVGEAEGLWPRLLVDVQAGRLQRIYRHEELPDLAETPVPRRELIRRTARRYVTTHAVQVGRGCSHGCRYCSVSAFHRRAYRTRPLENVLSELRGLPRNFMFVDDNIIQDREYARELFRAMVPMKKRWVSQCSLEIADDPELLRLARLAGCRGLFIGIETLSTDNLRALQKEFNDSSCYLQRLAAVRRAGIGVQAGIMVGMDADSPDVFERILRFLDAAKIDALQLNILTPLPGTPLFEDYRRAGRIIDTDWSHYDFRHTVIRPAQMTSLELQAGADWLYRQFYRMDRILTRTLRALLELGPVAAVMAWRLNLTYRYDNLREGVVGWNPARTERNSLRDRLVGVLCEWAEWLQGRGRAAPS
jgi:radical SAM superfamily enzyme YgiQ (UPF0313 family)